MRFEERPDVSFLLPARKAREPVSLRGGFGAANALYFISQLEDFRIFTKTLSYLFSLLLRLKPAQLTRTSQ